MMKRRWSYFVGLFLLMLGIFTGCEGLPELLDMPDQGVVQGEYDNGDSADEENNSKEDSPDEVNTSGEKNPDEKEASKENNSNEEDVSEQGNPKEESTPEEEGTPEEVSSDEENNSDEKASPVGEPDAVSEVSSVTVQEDGEYTSKEEVAAYLHEYGHLPDNFITKKDAKELGWVSNEGNLHEVAPGKSIGGDYFGNYEEILPKQNGRKYYECDIDTDGSYRGAKRIVYSNDGLIYYTEDHYTTFVLLYTEDGPAEE